MARGANGAASPVDGVAGSPSYSGSYSALQLPPALISSPSAAPPAFGRRQVSLLRDGPTLSAAREAAAGSAASPVLVGRRSSSGAGGIPLLERAAAGAGSPIPSSMSPTNASRTMAGRVRSSFATNSGGSSPALAAAVSAALSSSPGGASPPQLQAPRFVRAASSMPADEGKDKVAVKKPVQRGFGSSSRRS
jgi:hypothetical protein